MFLYSLKNTWIWRVVFTDPVIYFEQKYTNAILNGPVSDYWHIRPVCRIKSEKTATPGLHPVYPEKSGVPFSSYQLTGYAQSLQKGADMIMALVRMMLLIRVLPGHWCGDG